MIADGGDSGRSERCHGQEAVVGEIGLQGQRVVVERWIEVERVMLKRDQNGIDPGEPEACSKVDRYGAVDGI